MLSFIPPKPVVKTDWKKPYNKDCFAIFPNPTSDVLTLSTEIEGVQNASIRIVDMVGRTVYSDVLNINNEQTIDISYSEAIVG